MRPDAVAANVESSQRVTRKSVVPSSSRIPPVVLLRPAAFARRSPVTSQSEIATRRDRLTSTAKPATFRKRTAPP